MTRTRHPQKVDILVGLGLLIFLVYLNGLGNDFVSDDINWIPGNPRLGDFGFILGQFPNRFAMWLMYFFIHALTGINPLFYRLPNLIFHIGSTLLIYLLFEFLYKSKKLAIFTAALFAVHPILTESITWIAGGSYAQYSFFLLLSLLFYILSQEDRKIYLASLGAFVISLLFSEKAVVIGAIFFLYELTYGKLSQNWKKILPYLGLSGVYAFFLLTRVGERVSGLTTRNYLEPGFYNPLTQIPVAISEYLKLIFWPQALTLYHSEMSFSQEQYLIRVGIFLVFISLIAFSFYKSLKSYKTYKFVFFWLTFFVITLTPNLTPLRIAWVVAERYVYLGTLGVLAIVALLLKKLSDNPKLQIPVYVLFALFIFSLGTRTVFRNNDWKNEDNLWMVTAKTSPSSPNTHNNLGDVYARHGELEKAAEEFELATKIQPNYADAYHNLANTYQKIAERDRSEDFLRKAEENYQLAIQYNSNLWQSYQNLGAIYFEKSDFEKAIKYFEDATKINPDNLNLKYNLGIVYLKAGQKDLAQQIFLSILKIDPGNPTVLNALKEID